MNLSSLNVSLAHIPTDWIILFAVAIVVAAYSLYFGTSRMIALCLALPLTYVATLLTPKTAFVASALGMGGAAGAFIVLLEIALFTLCIHFIVRDYSNSAYPLQAVLTAAATMILMAVFWIQMPALNALWHFSSNATNIFGSAYAFFWIVFSYLLLVAVRR